MNQNEPIKAQPESSQNAYNPLSAMRQGERVIFEIRRHPIGLIGIYVPFAIMLAFAGFAAIAAPGILADQFDRALVASISASIFGVAAVLSLLFVFIAHKVYFGNRWILTSDSLTQLTQRSLFNKQTSQLGLDNLEDVTAEQNGILTHLFNYGVLRCQTAGEQGKFLFVYCPKPHDYAQKMLIARENFEHGTIYTEPDLTQKG